MSRSGTEIAPSAAVQAASPRYAAVIRSSMRFRRSSGTNTSSPRAGTSHTRPVGPSSATASSSSRGTRNQGWRRSRISANPSYVIGLPPVRFIAVNGPIPRRSARRATSSTSFEVPSPSSTASAAARNIPSKMGFRAWPNRLSTATGTLPISS